MSVRIPGAADGVSSGIAQPEAIYTSAIEAALTNDTQAIAFRHSANTMTLAWPHYNNAPLCKITAAATATDFYHQGDPNTSRIEIPWRVVNRQNSIECIVQVVASMSSVPICLRMQTRALIGGASTTNGIFSQRLNGGAIWRPVSQSIWRRTQNGNAWKTTQALCVVEGPSLGSYDDFVIVPQAIIDSPTMPWDSLSGTYSYDVTLFISSITIREHASRVQS